MFFNITYGNLSQKKQLDRSLKTSIYHCLSSFSDTIRFIYLVVEDKVFDGYLADYLWSSRDGTFTIPFVHMSHKYSEMSAVVYSSSLMFDQPGRKNSFVFCYDRFLSEKEVEDIRSHNAAMTINMYFSDEVIATQQFDEIKKAKKTNEIVTFIKLEDSHSRIFPENNVKPENNIKSEVLEKNQELEGYIRIKTKQKNNMSNEDISTSQFAANNKNATGGTEGPRKTKTLCILKPEAMYEEMYKKIVKRLIDEGFVISYGSIKKYDEDLWNAFYYDHRDKEFYDDLCKYLSNKPVGVFILERVNAMDHLRDIIGNNDPSLCSPDQIRHMFKRTGKLDNGIHGSDSRDGYLKELNCLFGGGMGQRNASRR